MDQVGCTITPVRFTVGSLMFWSGVLERVVCCLETMIIDICDPFEHAKATGAGVEIFRSILYVCNAALVESV